MKSDERWKEFLKTAEKPELFDDVDQLMAYMGYVWGVRGWARNLDDGRVEVLALGTPHQLEDFEAELRVGPPRAMVRHLTVEETAEVARVEGFHIR